jgi:hypothetical protein
MVLLFQVRPFSMQGTRHLQTIENTEAHFERAAVALAK